MTRTFAIAVFIAAAIVARTPAPAADDLLTRMAAVNPQLHTFTATVHAHVALKTFPFLGADLTGMVYHKEPSLTKVVITEGLPMIAQQFDKLMVSIPGPADWKKEYTIGVPTDDGTLTTFKLVPYAKNNLASVQATVDDKTATIVGMRGTT